MKIVIEIGHPANVHYFKHFYWAMKSKGAKIKVIVRDIDVAVDLLNSYDIPFYNRGKGYKSFIGKIYYLFLTNIKILFLTLKFKPNVYISMSSPYPFLASKFVNMKSIVFDDTEVGKFEQMIYKKYAHKILTPVSFYKYLGVKHKKFNSFMELFYLHPNYFKPNNEILNLLNINDGQKFVLIRMVAWGATHDHNQSGISQDNLDNVIQLCEKSNLKIILSTEAQLPNKYDKYIHNFPPNKIHDILYFAELYIGEGATTASESVMLGTPAIYINSINAGTLKDQEKSGLLFSYRSFDKKVINQIEGIIIENNKKKWRTLKDDFIKGKEDMTSYLLNVINNL